MPRVKAPRNPHRLQRSPHALDGAIESGREERQAPNSLTSATTPYSRDESRVGKARSSKKSPSARPQTKSTDAFDIGAASPPDAVILREQRRLSGEIVGTNVSPVEQTLKTKRIARPTRTPKSIMTLEERLDRTEISEEMAAEIIEKLYEEQEKDDRDMYDITTQTVKEETKCELSSIVEELDVMEFRRLLTYGEVSVESVSSTLLPFLDLQADDVFYDLGCGTGKIVIQVALQTSCMVSKGIELMHNRVMEGAKAMQRLENLGIQVLSDKEINVVQGDILKPPAGADMMDATVVFINNVCFGPELMLKVMGMLSSMPKLRRVVTLRKFCERHRPQKCVRANNYCVEYVHPPDEAEINVSWASKTSLYLYERVESSLANLAEQLQVPVQVES